MSQETKLSKNEDLLPLIKTYRNNLEKQINKVYIFGENKKRKLKLPFVELISIEKSEYSYKQLLASQLLDRSSLIKRSTNLENSFENENLNIDGNEKSSNDKLETTKKIKISSIR